MGRESDRRWQEHSQHGGIACYSAGGVAQLNGVAAGMNRCDVRDRQRDVGFANQHVCALKEPLEAPCLRADRLRGEDSRAGLR